MATIYEEIRTLAHDFEVDHILPDASLRIILGFVSYEVGAEGAIEEGSGDWKANVLLAAYEYALAARTHHADQTPERAMKFAMRAQHLATLIANPINVLRYVRDSVAPDATTFPGQGVISVSGLSRTQVLALIAAAGHATVASVAAAQSAADAATASADAAAADLAQSFIGANISGSTLTFTRQSGDNPRVLTLPNTGEGGMVDGVIMSATVNVAQETVTVTTSTNATVSWDLTPILDVIRARINASRVYLGPYSNLSSAQRAAIEIGDYTLLHNRFWVAHFQSQARSNAPGSGVNDGWRPIDGQFRGNATTLGRFYDPGDHTVVEGVLFFCEVEGTYAAADIPGSSDWSGGGLNVAGVDARLDLRIVTLGPTGVLGTPTATEYNNGTLKSLGGHAYYARRTGHTAVASAWTWGDLGTNVLAGYRGVTGQNPGHDIADAALNDWAYDRVGRSWNRYLGTVWAHSVPPPGFDPHYSDESSAQQSGLVAVGSYIYDVSQRRVRVITAYTGATPSNLTYIWTALNPGDDAEVIEYANQAAAEAVTVAANAIQWWP